MELSELKRDRAMFFAFLGISALGKHLPCPFHKGGDSFSVWQGRDGIWIWKCHSGCGTGTIVDAAMLRYNVRHCAAAVECIEKELGVKIGRDEEYVEPIIDNDRAESLIKAAHDYLMSNFSVQETWLIGKRGISNLATVEKYRLGFLPGVDITFKKKETGRPYPLKIFGWVLPITNARGVLQAVKFHTEKECWPGAPKCLFAPFGTYPATEPRHGSYTLWPAPEQCPAGADLYLHPGELKALAHEAAGFYTTSPTSGENKFPDRFVKRIGAVGAGKVFLPYDDDKPKMVNGVWRSPGNEWKDAMVKALAVAGIPCFPFSFGTPQPADAPTSQATPVGTESENTESARRNQNDEDSTTNPPAPTATISEEARRFGETEACGVGEEQCSAGNQSEAPSHEDGCGQSFNELHGTYISVLDPREISEATKALLELRAKPGDVGQEDQGQAYFRETDHPAAELDGREHGDASERGAGSRYSLLVEEIKKAHASKGETFYISPGATEDELLVLRIIAEPYESLGVRTYDKRHFLV